MELDIIYPIKPYGEFCEGSILSVFLHLFWRGLRMERIRAPGRDA